MVRVILWHGCLCVHVCVHVQGFSAFKVGLRWSSLAGAHRRTMPPLRGAGRGAPVPANPAGDTHYLAILTPGWACCSSRDSSIRETSPEPLLRASAWLPLNIQILRLWHLSVLAALQSFIFITVSTTAVWRPNQRTRLMDLRIQEADKACKGFEQVSFEHRLIQQVIGVSKMRPQVQNREFQGSFG